MYVGVREAVQEHDGNSITRKARNCWQLFQEKQRWWDEGWWSGVTGSGRPRARELAAGSTDWDQGSRRNSFGWASGKLERKTVENFSVLLEHQLPHRDQDHWILCPSRPLKFLNLQGQEVDAVLGILILSYPELWSQKVPDSFWLPWARSYHSKEERTFEILEFKRRILVTYLHIPANDPTVHITFLGSLCTRQALLMWEELPVSPTVSQ